MTTYFSDTFTRADGPLSSPWITPSGGAGLTIASNVLVPTTGTSGAANLYLPSASNLTYPNTRNIAASVTVSGVDGTANVLDQWAVRLRYDLTSGYRARWLGDGTLAIFNPIALTTVLASTTTAAPVVGDVLKFQAYDNVLSVYINGGLVLSVADDKWDNGNYVSIVLNQSGVTTTMGAFALAAPTPLSVVDDPNTLPPANNYLICQRTGFKVKVSEGLKEEWNGTQVRAKSWEPRQVLDLMRNRAERSTPSNSPEGADTFIESRYPSGVSINDLDG